MSDDSPVDIEHLQSFDLALLANFVHQVVNPLNGVAGTLDNLAEGVIVDEKRRDQRLRAARAQLEQCISLVRNLAYLAQGFGRIQPSEKKTIVLPQVIIESAMFFAEDAENNGIRFELEDRISQNRVSGHPDLIRQVLMNIFDNCVKYGELHKPVSIKQWVQRRTENAMITIETRSRLPVNPNDIAKLFNLGFRGANARQIVASGTGLGLYISKRIVEDVHSGSIDVQTSGSQGLIFTVRLPGATAGAEQPQREHF